MTKRRVFYSFHYKNDCWRVQQIRNMGAFEEVDDSDLPTPNDWETILRTDESSIKRWINYHLNNRRTCTIVLIGEKTASRRWVKYEIKQSWNMGMGVIGIYIHNLRDMNGNKSRMGINPFTQFGLEQIVPVYNPDPYNAYSDIKYNLGVWIEEGIRRQQNYGNFKV